MKVIELSIKILKEFSFNINEVDKLRSELVSPYNTGVYVLREGNSFLYVGMSNSLRNRITEHLNGVGSSGEFVDRIDRIEVFITENKDRKSTRLNSSHVAISYAVFCLKKKKKITRTNDIHK